METLHIALCDDEQEELNSLASYLSTYLEERGQKAEIRTFTSSFDLLDHLDKYAVDLIFLDIIMPGMNGIATAKELLKIRPETRIIFLTSTRDYAVDSYTVHAVYYLLKPLDPAMFKTAMDKAIEELSAPESTLLLVKGIGGTAVRIFVKDITYIQSSGHQQLLYLKDNYPVTARQSLNSIVETLDCIAPKQFISPCKGYLVNLSEVATVTPEKLTLLNGVPLPISRNCYRAVKEAFFDHCFVKVDS